MKRNKLRNLLTNHIKEKRFNSNFFNFISYLPSEYGKHKNEELIKLSKDSELLINTKSYNIPKLPKKQFKKFKPLMHKQKHINRNYNLLKINDLKA